MKTPWAGTDIVTLKAVILLVAKYAGFFALSKVLTANKVRILAYHGIWLGDAHFGNFLFMRSTTFARRMELLSRWGYPVVALSEAVSLLTPVALSDAVGISGKVGISGQVGLSDKAKANPPNELPRLSTVITIDDGWYGTYSDMLPVLERYRFPATVYITTYYCLNQAPVINVAIQYCLTRLSAQQHPVLHIPSRDFGPFVIANAQELEHTIQLATAHTASMDHDNEQQDFLRDLCDATGVDHARLVSGRWFHLMTQEEVADAARRGISFELHTHRHRTSWNGQEYLVEELSDNRVNILKLTDRNPVHFCYPSGIVSADMWSALESSDIRSATTTEAGLVSKGNPPFILPRILDGEEVSELEFEAEMSGFLQLVRNFRGYFKHR